MRQLRSHNFEPAFAVIKISLLTKLFVRVSQEEKCNKEDLTRASYKKVFNEKKSFQ